MEVQTMSMPLSESMGDAIFKGQLASWLDDTDVSALLNIDAVTSLDLQSVPTKTPEYFCMPDSPFSSPYSSPELPEMDNSLGMAPPLFDEQLLEVDAMIFEDTFNVNPEMLPELEKILSSVDPSIISPPASPLSPSSDFVPDTSRTSKKRKGADGKECGDDSIFLPRNQLLTMTSTEIEDYVAKIKAQRTLTVSEEKELKRQRRLIKNREYASQSRSRKKQYVDELEKTIETIRGENSSLKQQVTTLSDENRTLKRQILAIATTIKKKSAPSSTSSAGAPNTFTKLTSIGAGRSGNNVKTVSACLMAIMFMVFTFEVLWEKQPLVVFPNQQNINFNPRALLTVEGLADPPRSLATTRWLRDLTLDKVGLIANFLGLHSPNKGLVPRGPTPEAKGLLQSDTHVVSRSPNYAPSSAPCLLNQRSKSKTQEMCPNSSFPNPPLCDCSEPRFTSAPCVTLPATCA